jgi:hypothetical protein
VFDCAKPSPCAVTLAIGAYPFGIAFICDPQADIRGSQFVNAWSWDHLSNGGVAELSLSLQMLNPDAKHWLDPAGTLALFKGHRRLAAAQSLDGIPEAVPLIAAQSQVGAPGAF